MSLTSSNSPASAAAPLEVLLAASKAEVQQLRDALHEIALRDTGEGSSGRGGSRSSMKGAFSEALEGKYLTLIKKHKDLTVQLGTTQQRLAAAQKALQAEQEKTQRLVAAVTVSSLGERGGKGNCKSSAADTGVDDDGRNSGSKINGGSGGAVGSSVSVARVYDQLHQKELAMAEVLRENAALRTLIQREVGLRDDTKEVDGLLRRVTPALNGGAGGGGSTAAPAVVSGKSAAGADGGGWRGRAEEIVLLKSKLKDAQREAARAVVQSGRSDDGVDARTDSQAPHTPARAFLAVDTDSTAEARSVAATTTAAQGRRARRDVDDDARDRLNIMQQQRAAQLRELTADLAHHQHLLREERIKSSALQARVQTMKSELDTLRNYVDTILEKSSADDELVAAYKTELQRAQEDTRHWQRVAADVMNGANGARGHGSSETSTAFTVSGMRNGLNNAAAAATRIAPYRKAAGGAAASGGGGDEQQHSISRPLSPSQPLNPLSGSLYEWIRQVCDEVPPEVDPESTPPAVAASAKQLAAVLRQAFQYILLVERQSMTAAELAHPDTKPTDGDDVLLKENNVLKNRIRALSDVLEKELQMQRALWATTEAGVAKKNSDR